MIVDNFGKIHGIARPEHHHHRRARQYRPRSTHLINKLLTYGQGNIWTSTDASLAVIDLNSFAVRALQRADGIE
jgi:hypothetical protein